MEGEGDKERCFICGFILQMAITTGAGPDWSQKPGTSSGALTARVGAPARGPFSTAFQVQQQGAGPEAEKLDLKWHSSTGCQHHERWLHYHATTCLPYLSCCFICQQCFCSRALQGWLLFISKSELTLHLPHPLSQSLPLMLPCFIFYTAFTTIWNYPMSLFFVFFNQI